MASAARVARYTPEQYLALERKAEFKSEFYDGFIIRDVRCESRAQHDRG